jgi:hypothetical protein
MGIATCHCERSAAIKSRVCVATAVLLLTIVSTATAQYAGGSGTADDPYQIATAADLILLGESPADYDKQFLLTADIDLDPNLPDCKVFDKAVLAVEGRQIDIRHELEVLDPVVGLGPDGVPLLGRPDWVRVVRRAAAATIFSLGRKADEANRDQERDSPQDS